nr:MAG TPA: hypothetical protein [Caudoviricetes sp.]
MIGICNILTVVSNHLITGLTYICWDFLCNCLLAFIIVKILS